MDFTYPSLKGNKGSFTYLKDKFMVIFQLGLSKAVIKVREDGTVLPRNLSVSHNGRFTYRLFSHYVRRCLTKLQYYNHSLNGRLTFQPSNIHPSHIGAIMATMWDGRYVKQLPTVICFIIKRTNPGKEDGTVHCGFPHSNDPKIKLAKPTLH